MLKFGDLGRRMTNGSDSIGGIPVTSEQLGFKAGEMIACGKCSKPNPPNRLNCLYCGLALELPSHLAAGIQFRPNPLEDWESGVNVVAVGGLNETSAKALASAIAYGPELVAPLSEVEPPLPLFRVSPAEAETVVSRSSAAGLRVESVDDRDLLIDQPLSRIKGIVFGSNEVGFHLFNTGEVVQVGSDDVALIVVGMIVSTSSEAKVKRTKKEVKSFDEYMSSSDHAVIDIYLRSDPAGFRIVPHGFDFSCLGDRKSLLAVENIRLLNERLRVEFSTALFDDSYPSKIQFLDKVWPRTRVNTSKGSVRGLFRAQYLSGESTSNEEQFTRYSRMRRKLL